MEIVNKVGMHSNTLCYMVWIIYSIYIHLDTGIIIYFHLVWFSVKSMAEKKPTHTKWRMVLKKQECQNEIETWVFAGSWVSDVRVSLTDVTVKIFKVILFVRSKQQVECLGSLETLTSVGNWNIVRPGFNFHLDSIWHQKKVDNTYLALHSDDIDSHNASTSKNSF